MTDKEEIDYKEKFEELHEKYEDLLDVLYREDVFLVEGTTECMDDSRAFKNDTCVYNKRLDMAYSATEIVEILNTTSERIDSLEKALDETYDVIRKVVNVLEEGDIDKEKILKVIYSESTFN